MGMMKFINLTPHIISIYKENGDIVNFEPSGEVVRLITNFDGNENKQRIHRWYGWQILEYSDDKMKLDKPELIGKEFDGNMYIVSNPVSKFCKRYNVIAPDTSPESAIRDEKGNIIGVKWFCCYT